MPYRCHAADRLTGGFAHDGCGCHRHHLSSDAGRESAEVGAVASARHHQHGGAVGEKDQAVRYRRHVAADGCCGLSCGPGGVGEHEDLGADPCLVEVLLHEPAAFGE